MSDRVSPPIRCTREVLVYSDSSNLWVRVYFDEVATPAGPARYNRVVEGPPGAGPPAVVVPVTATGRIMFVRTYRYPVARWLLELPRGFGEADYSAVETARRELQEETGCSASSVDEIGAVLPNSGILTTSVPVFVARLAPGFMPSPQIEEGVSAVLTLSRREIDARIREGTIADGVTLGALSIYERWERATRRPRACP